MTLVCRVLLRGVALLSSINGRGPERPRRSSASMTGHPTPTETPTWDTPSTRCAAASALSSHTLGPTKQLFKVDLHLVHSNFRFKMKSALLADDDDG